MGKPDFLCIGAQKAGTTWLQNMLQQHPDVFFGPFKEYQFFNSLFVPRNRKWTCWHVKNSVKHAMLRHLNSSAFDAEYIRRLSKIADEEFMFSSEWYEYIYSSRNSLNKVKGDITPEYSTIPQGGVEYIKDYLHSPKIIYIIRDPVDRAISQIRMNIQRGQKFSEEKDKITWDVLNRGDYKAYIPRWDEVFGDDVLYIPYGHISSRPEIVLEMVENHVGLSHFKYRNIGEKVHVTKKSKVSNELKELLENSLSVQRLFLIERFGDEFFNDI